MSNESSATAEPSVREVFDRLRAPAARSHTIRPVEEIVRELHIGPVERFLLWLSKTDYYTLALSTYATRRTLVGLGMMVLFTTLLAFASSLYALLTTLVSPDSALRWPVAIALACLYAFGILIIDREIVGAVSRKSLWIRFLFAIFIAVAVSWPVKLKFFEGRLQLEITRMVDEKNADKLKRIDELKSTGEPERQQQRTAIQSRMTSIDREIAVLDDEISRESRIVECGRKCQGFRQQKDALMLQRKDAEAALAALSAPNAVPEDIRKEIEDLEHQVKDEHEISYDFLTKWEALDRIKRAPGSDYAVLSWFLMGFFMLLEMVPLALKWSLGKTEYHFYQESRMNLNAQKIVSATNLFMQAMQRDPNAVLDLMPLEISDIIAALMEDEAMGGQAPVDYRGLAAILRGTESSPSPRGGVVPPSSVDAQPTPADTRRASEPAAAAPRRPQRSGDDTVFESPLHG